MTRKNQGENEMKITVMVIHFVSMANKQLPTVSLDET